MEKVDDVSSEVGKLEWWKRYAMQLPHWSAACKLILLMQPFSAAAKLVFLLLTNSSEQQTSALDTTRVITLILYFHVKNLSILC